MLLTVAAASAATLSGAAALAAWEFGADMLRVHDVAETVQALRVWLAIGDGV
jgi:dihydropteroate synthase